MQATPDIEEGSISQAELGRRVKLAIPTLRIRLAWAGIRGTRAWREGPIFFSKLQVEQFEKWLDQHDELVPA